MDAHAPPSPGSSVSHMHSSETIVIPYPQNETQGGGDPWPPGQEPDRPVHRPGGDPPRQQEDEGREGRGGRSGVPGQDHHRHPGPPRVHRHGFSVSIFIIVFDGFVWGVPIVAKPKNAAVLLPRGPGQAKIRKFGWKDAGGALLSTSWWRVEHVLVPWLLRAGPFWYAHSDPPLPTCDWCLHGYHATPHHTTPHHTSSPNRPATLRSGSQLPFKKGVVVDATEMGTITDLPDSCAIIGGGVIAVEYANVLAGLGVGVSLLCKEEVG